jgi:hypothetical protein
LPNSKEMYLWKIKIILILFLILFSHFQHYFGAAILLLVN